MTLNKFTLLAATAAVGAFGTGSAQAQLAFPAATIVGAGASLPQNVARQAGDCYGIKNNLGFGVASGGTAPAAVSLVDFDFDTPAADTDANRFNCAVRDVQPAITTRYLSTGSGQGVTAFLNNRVTSSFVYSSGFAVYADGDGYQYSFSETALSGANLVTYASTTINPFTRYPAAKNALELFGAPIQVPVVLAAVAVGYSPVYAKVRLGDSTVKAFTFKTPAAGLKLTRAQYCGIYNGTITNWNQLPTAVVDRDPTDTAPFNVPIRLVGRSETSGTTSLFTRAIAAQCTGLSVPTGVGGTGTPVAIVNKFGNSENRLPYDGVTTVSGTAYTGTAGTVSPTNSLSGAFFNKATGLISSGTEAAGQFTVANGNDGVAAATAYLPDPSATEGDRTQNGRINYVSPEQTLPAVIFNGANTFALKAALLQVGGTGTVFVAPDAKNTSLAFGTVAPPQTKGGAGAYCSDSTACPSAYGNRNNPLDWVAAADKSVGIANPTKGYPMIGSSNALLYTCYATPARRQAVNGYFATLLGKTPKTSVNTAMPAALVTDAVNGIFSKNGLSPLPGAWRTAITETFLKSSAQLGRVGDATTKLGLRNLWIQDKIPTTPTGAGSLTAGNSLCVGKPGA